VMTARYITTGDAARALGISSATLNRWAAAGTVTPAERTAGGHYRWDLPVLRAQVRRLNPDRERVLAEEIAAVIHDANRRLQIIEGDPRPSPMWDDIPASLEYQVRETIESVQQALDDPGRTPEQNHQGWVDRMVADGWTYGPVKDAPAKTHPLLVPFGQMPAEAQAKDRLFIAIVRALAPQTTAGDDQPVRG